MKKLITVFLALILIFSFAGCNGGDNSGENTIATYKIYYLVDETIHATAETAGNEILSLPSKPIKPDYVFVGWFFENNEKFTGSYYLNKSLTENIIINAKFTFDDSGESDIPIQLVMSTLFYDDTTKLITWNEVENAISYVLTLTGQDVNRTVTIATNSKNTTTNKYEYEISEETSGNYQISIIAKGNDVNYLDSTAKITTVDYTKAIIPPVSVTQEEFNQIVAATLSYMEDESKCLGIEGEYEQIESDYTSSGKTNYFIEKDKYSFENEDGIVEYYYYEGDLEHKYVKNANGECFYYLEYRNGGIAGRDMGIQPVLMVANAFPFVDFDGIKYVAKPNCLDNIMQAYAAVYFEYYKLDEERTPFENVNFTEFSFIISNGMISSVSGIVESALNEDYFKTTFSYSFTLDETMSIEFPTVYTTMWGSSWHLPIAIAQDVNVSVNKGGTYYEFTALQSANYKLIKENVNCQIYVFSKRGTRTNGFDMNDCVAGFANIDTFIVETGHTYYIYAYNSNEQAYSFRLEEATFGLPVDGKFELGKSFSNTPIWFTTTRFWELHQGLDFLVEEYTEVKAIADGMITNIINSHNEGNVVTIQHNNGLVSIYKGLADDINVSIGDIISSGTVIGTVGVMPVEAGEYDKPHLHLEIKLNGVNVNPLDYLPSIGNK